MAILTCPRERDMIVHHFMLGTQTVLLTDFGKVWTRTNLANVKKLDRIFCFVFCIATRIVFHKVVQRRLNVVWRERLRLAWKDLY